MPRRKIMATQPDGTSETDTVDIVEETIATQAETVVPAAAPAAATLVVFIDPTVADGGDGSEAVAR